jgi:hypothetical protein
LSGGLIVLAGTAALSPQKAFHEQVVHAAGDTRLESVRSFFHKFDCPAEALAPQFIDAADTYHLDWRLLPSIAFVETIGGKGAVNNNMFGWDNGRARFPSLSTGIYSVGYQLGTSAFYRNKDLDRVLQAYNPVGSYAQSVKSVMSQIAPVR